MQSVAPGEHLLESSASILNVQKPAQQRDHHAHRLWTCTRELATQRRQQTSDASRSVIHLKHGGPDARRSNLAVLTLWPGVFNDPPDQARAPREVHRLPKRLTSVACCSTKECKNRSFEPSSFPPCLSIQGDSEEIPLDSHSGVSVGGRIGTRSENRQPGHINNRDNIQVFKVFGRPDS